MPVCTFSRESFIDSHLIGKGNGLRAHVRGDKKTKKTDSLSTVGYGAGDEARTRYLHLGKVALYRMSYTRISNAGMIIADFFQKSRADAKFPEKNPRAGRSSARPVHMFQT